MFLVHICDKFAVQEAICQFLIYLCQSLCSVYGYLDVDQQVYQVDMQVMGDGGGCDEKWMNRWSKECVQAMGDGWDGWMDNQMDA